MGPSNITPGVIHHRVETPELGDRAFHSSLRLGLIGDICCDDEGASTLAGDRGGQLAEAILAARHHRDRRALVGERMGRRLADAAAGPGDQRHRSIKSICHVINPLLYLFTLMVLLP